MEFWAQLMRLGFNFRNGDTEKRALRAGASEVSKWMTGGGDELR